MNFKRLPGKILECLLTASLKKAAKEQKLNRMVNALEKIVPDISGQYSVFRLDNDYLKIKVRNLHSFQMSLISEVIEKFEHPTLVDIGDSCGTHLQYINGIYSKNNGIRCLGINLDAEAVERIKEKGIDALKIRAEEIHKHNIDADIFLCLEIIEHLTDPCRFLHELSAKTKAEFLVITVPYLKKSRVGLHHIRANRPEQVCAENTHIFELNPEDWKLLVRHSGWSIDREKIYLQYPLKNILRITNLYWRRFDYEGFYGLILKRDTSWSEKYRDWQRRED